MIVVGDCITVHMVFPGHFTGTFGKTKAQGQAIDFIATDLLKVAESRITDNWHIEDNLTLLTQMGVAKVEQWRTRRFFPCIRLAVVSRSQGGFRYDLGLFVRRKHDDGACLRRGDRRLLLCSACHQAAQQFDAAAQPR